MVFIWDNLMRRMCSEPEPQMLDNSYTWDEGFVIFALSRQIHTLILLFGFLRSNKKGLCYINKNMSF